MARILLVEDEPLVAQALGEMLTTAGHSVAYAGQEGDPAEAIASAPYDVLVTDIFLPENSGWDLIRAVRRSRPEAGIVAISGGNVGVTAELALKISDLVGANEILPKPVAAEELLRAIDAALQQRR
jgi:DNA-binding response OmpR family regulator